MELCSTIRDELASYLGAGVKVSVRKDRCVVTLPFTTLDKRRVTVVVEQHAPNTFIVHDGGKTSSELFCQGVNMTRKKEEHQAAIAAKFGVHITGRLFKKYCKPGELQDGILAVAQSALMAMAELIDHKPVVEEETLGAKVSRVLQGWKPEYVRAIERNVTVDGVTAPHSFHFLSYPYSCQLQHGRHQDLEPRPSALAGGTIRIPGTRHSGRSAGQFMGAMRRCLARQRMARSQHRACQEILPSNAGSLLRA